MHSRIEQYLDEMERPLRRLPYHLRRELIDEAGQHLENLVAESEAERQLSVDDAITKALERFGVADQVGKSLDREVGGRLRRKRLLGIAGICTFGLAGAVGTLALAVMCGAPLDIAGCDPSGLYAILGGLFGIAAALRRKREAWIIAGVLAAAFVVVPLSVHLNIALSLVGGNLDKSLFGKPEYRNESVGTILRYLLLTGQGVWPAVDSIAILIPTMTAGALIWGRRRMTAGRAALIGAVAFGLIVPFLDEQWLTRAYWLSREMKCQDAVWYLLLSAKQGAITGLLLWGTRAVAEPVVKAVSYLGSKLHPFFSGTRRSIKTI